MKRFLTKIQKRKKKTKLNVIEKSMLDYLQKYAASLAYLMVFGLLGLSSSFFSLVMEDSFLKTVASSSLSNLFISFYCAVYFIVYYATRKISMLPLHAGETSVARTSSSCQAQEVEKEEFLPPLSATEKSEVVFYQSTVLWYHVYSFGFAIFCLTYSISQMHSNASLFLCLGSCLVSHGQSFHLQGRRSLQDPAGHSLLVCYLQTFVFMVHFLCFSSWLYYFSPTWLPLAQYASGMQNATLVPETPTVKEQFWRNIWFEMIGPLMAPMLITCFKQQACTLFAAERGEAKSAYFFVFFSLPLLALLSMFFLTLYCTLHDQAVKEALFRWQPTDEPILALAQVCVFHPCCLFFSLVIYIGGIGKSQYSLLCSSSLTLVFFIYSCFHMKQSIQNTNIIMPCLVMSLVGFFLSLLLLIIKVYRRECDFHTGPTTLATESL